MPYFRYKARDKTGKLVRGGIKAEGKKSLGLELDKMGLVPISFEEVSETSIFSFLDRFQSVKQEELNLFTRQLLALQKAGLPIVKSLSAIREQTKKKKLANALEAIIKDIKEGSNLSDALEKHPKIFNEFYSNMVRAAETGGILIDILDRLIEIGEYESNIKMKIKSATRYPIIALSAIGLGAVVIMTFIVPRFARVYSSMNVELPLPTQILIASNDFTQRYWWIVLLLIGTFIFLFNKFVSTNKGRMIWDGFKLKLPVFGKLLSMLYNSRFARITGVLTNVGVPVMNVLDLSARTSSNVIIKNAIEKIKDSVSQGKGMSEPMRETKVFAPIVIQMVVMGEESGKMDELLMSVADYYDRESDYIIKNLTTLIEPLLIIVLGVLILGIALAVFLPMWNIIKVVK